MDQRFEELVGPYRRELQAHCYRMLGSLADAEDQVQETLLRAWRGIDGFEGRASVRSWLYKIATHACIDLLRRRPVRSLPHQVGAPADPLAPVEAAAAEPPWVDPCPEPLWEATAAGPEATVAARESVKLAFIVALQHLPATQRAVLILREVLGWSAAEVAELLDTSVAGVNSALQRARATLDERRDRRPSARPEDPGVQELLDRYLRAWEGADVDALVALLHQDVITSMPPVPTWLRGRAALDTFIRSRIGEPGALVLRRLACADELGFAFYRRFAGETGFRAHALQILRVDGGEISELHVFVLPDLFRHFGLPDQL